MFLAIESSASSTFVAVGDESKSFESRSEISLFPESRGSEQLHILAREVVSQAGISWKDVKGIVVGAGPGSFTGLRLGLAFAQGIALSLKVPCIGISSFEGWVWEFVDGNSNIITLASAQRGEYFFREFDSSGRPISSSEIVPGNLILEHARKLNVVNPKIIGFVEPMELDGILVSRPTKAASGLLVIGAKRLRESVYDLLAISSITPEYLRAVSARTIAERAPK